MKRLVLWLAALPALLAFALPREVFAQADAPEVSASAEPRDVEVGETFSVSLSVTVEASGPSPNDPHLAHNDGLRAGPPSISSQTQISWINGHMSRRSGITATWQVIASREGVFVVTPSVGWNGKKLQANTLRIVVHAATQGGRRRQAPTAPNPFDPFGNPFGMFPKLPGIFDSPEPEVPPAAPANPELSLDQPLDSRVFLHSVVSQKNPVVGEQVTLTVYVYARATSLRSSNEHQPSVPDFFVRELMQPGVETPPQSVVINGVIWRVQSIFQKALFPLRAGELEIGPMQVTWDGMRGSGIAGAVRESEAIKLRVSEPPSAGRPVGYQIGDVGSYALSATVEPRTAEVGGAVAVTATLTGVGNVPNAVRIPASASVEWLDPQLRENLDVENGKVRGSRTFSYVVRPKTPGIVDLGDITLPYWNPERAVYEIARASLGKVQVAPEKTSPLAKDPGAPHDPWSSLGSVRAELGNYPHAREPPTEKPWYWFGLFGGPFAVVAGSLGSKGARRLRSWFAQRRTAAESGIDGALAQAREARKKDDPRMLAGALERAVYLAIERATGLKARALLLDDVPRALEERSVPSELAQEIRELLSSIEAIRYTPDVAPRAGDLADRVARAVRRMGRLPPVARV
jgi:hypothetical protein